MDWPLPPPFAESRRSRRDPRVKVLGRILQSLQGYRFDPRRDLLPDRHGFVRGGYRICISSHLYQRGRWKR